ncbi:type II toxin-antitoxin system VapC family toxin [Nostoc sp. LEGE 12447]|uniref:type II toxin-antitoxin system VapC family toxin n=1 Tax=Nostoc TaxID=1177 RepID=UPI00188315A4|nr:MULTISPECIES: PIN domain-containing protein [Nostoc]MBE9002055.1 type II toxin-antitoxin system VapC family toxin [Nostoc sp. LEGE 12447]MBG1259996.1 type II toxin-antitoxin system VapC family toxin [Nostoc commune BAE]MBG1262469.1 type II toxin-antitoxin system VapC family toxin [Nostoc commune BAE]
MATKFFIDTWGWLTLHDKSERYYQEATQAYQRAIAQNGQIYTTDYVLDETFTFFFRRLPAPIADQSMKALLSAFLADNFYLIRITEERFAQTQVLRSKFLDKPLISFTDLTSMVVMQECNITTILTEDAHFTHVGMGFELVP